MKNILKTFTILATLFFITGCNGEFELIDENRPVTEIHYTTKDNKPAELYTHNGVITNTYSDDSGLLLLDGSINSLGRYFRANSQLTSITIPNGIEIIEDDAFNGCSQLAKITIPTSLTSIGSNAFKNCYSLKLIYNLSGLNLKAGSTNHGYIAYYANQVLNTPEGAELIGDYVFHNEDETPTLIGANYTSSGANLKSTYNSWTSSNKINNSTNSKTYTVNGSTGDKFSFYWAVSSESGYDKFSIKVNGSEVLNKSGEDSGIYEYTFAYNHSIEVVVAYTKDGSTSNGDDEARISNVKLTTNQGINLELPENYKGESYAIGDNFITNDNLIQSITIPVSVINIGYKAFFNCNKLNTVYCKATTPPTIEDAVFNSCDNLNRIYVPMESVSLYKSQWSQYSEYIAGYDF